MLPDYLLTDSILLDVAERGNFSNNFTWTNFHCTADEASSWSRQAKDIIRSTMITARTKASFILYVIIILLALEKHSEADKFKSAILSENISGDVLLEALQLVLTRYAGDIEDAYKTYANFYKI